LIILNLFTVAGAALALEKSAPNFPFNHQEKYPSGPENGREIVRDKSVNAR